MEEIPNWRSIFPDNILRLFYFTIMKKILFVLCLFISGNIFSQKIYSAGYLGYSHSVYHQFNYNTKRVERFKQDYIFFAMPIGYKYRSYLFESGGSYNGNAYINLMAGKRIELKKKLSFDLLAGVADNISLFPKQEEFVPQVEARINWKFLSIQSSYLDHTFQIGIGFQGFIDN